MLASSDKVVSSATYPVQYGIDVSVRIDRTEDTAFVLVIAPLYQHREWKLSMCWSTTFTDYDIMRDRAFVTTMLRHFPA